MGAAIWSTTPEQMRAYPLAAFTRFFESHGLLTLVDRLIVMDGGLLVADGPKDQVMEALASGRIQTAKT